MKHRLLFGVLVAAAALSASANDRSWENPVFESLDEAVAAAKLESSRLDDDSPAALRLFVDLTLANGDSHARHSSSNITRTVHEGFLVTHPSSFDRNQVQRRTIERFLGALPRQQAVVEARLARFGYPELPGLVYTRLVDSVDAFAGLSRASSDRMSRVGGVTYYCRYVVLPLSYVGEASLDELRRSAARDPSLDVEGTIRRWQSESFASLVNTFRHELVHVHTNSSLGVPRYSNRRAIPTWFHEGTATYIAADPHAGLSRGYREFQELFFYLVQRHGVRKLQRFYSGILDGKDVISALAEVYSISGSEQLFARSARWHRAKELVKSGLWIAALAIVITAFRGRDRPYIGLLQVLAALALGLAVATGLAEHLYGLRGPGVVLAAKIGFVSVAVVVGSMGIRRVRSYGRRRAAAVIDRQT